MALTTVHSPWCAGDVVSQAILFALRRRFRPIGSMGARAGISAIPHERGSSVVLSVLIWLFLIFFSVLSLWKIKPPQPLPADVTPKEFSAQRALAHLRVIATAPRRIGSNANATVREYLLGELASLGLSPQVFPGFAGYASSRNFVIGKIQDVIGHLPGTASTGAILLMAHYDSVAPAPGAADDGAGVAAILEAVRALRAGARLRNDLIVLFTDGEEEGLLGARAFAAQPSLMKGVDLVLNFEARGDQGPSLPFETSLNNAALIQEVSQSARYPVGSSLFYALYKLLPNDTDFTVFRPSGTPGLNFAFGAGLESYHTSLDTVQNLSPASLQHHGSYVLSLARYFGQVDLKQLRQSRGDDVFFNWLGPGFVSYSEIRVLPAETLVTLLLACYIFLLLQRLQIQIPKLLLALIPALATLVVVPAVMASAWWLLARLLAGSIIVADSSANSFLLVGLGLLGLYAGLVVLAGMRRKFTVVELSLSGLAIICILSWILALKLPAGSYLLLWPLLLAILGAFLTTALRNTSQDRAQGFANIPAAAIAIFFFAALAYLLYVFLTLQFVAVVAVGVLLGVFVLISIPLMNLAIPENWRFALFPVLVALICLGVGAKLSHPGPRHPQRDTILYSLNADNGTAKWITYDRYLDEWTRQFFQNNHAAEQPVQDYLGGLQRSLISGSVPSRDLAPPVAQVTDHRREGDVHAFQVNVKSQRGADMLLLNFSDGIYPIAVKVGELDITARQNSTPRGIVLFGIPATGVDLEIMVKTGSKVTFWLLDQSAGLPEKVSPRPDNVIPGNSSDVTIVCRKYSL